MTTAACGAGVGPGSPEGMDSVAGADCVVERLRAQCTDRVLARLDGGHVVTVGQRFADGVANERLVVD